MKFYTVLVALVSLSLAQLVSASSVDPEQALFAYSRCIEIHSESLEGKTRLDAIDQWKSWIMEGGKDYNTECYVQCSLERMGLFDPASGKLKVNQIDEQFNKYGIMVGVSADDKDKLKNAFSSINADLKNCNDLFSEYKKKVHDNKDLLEIVRKLYHGYKETTKHVYEELAERGEPIRVRYQSYFEYCEKKFYKDDTDSLCKVRQYQIDDANPTKFKDHTECIFKGLRYIDGENNFNSSEIIRDFKLVNKPNFDEKIKQCTAKNEVVEVYKCFVQGETDFVEAFKEAFDYREIRSRDYAHRLKKPEYNPEEIQQQVEAIDKENSCK